MDIHLVLRKPLPYSSAEGYFLATHWNENGDIFRYRTLRKPARRTMHSISFRLYIFTSPPGKRGNSQLATDRSGMILPISSS